MLNEYKVLVTIFTKEVLTKEVIEQEVTDLLTAGGGVFDRNSLDAKSINVLLEDE